MPASKILLLITIHGESQNPLQMPIALLLE